MIMNGNDIALEMRKAMLDKGINQKTLAKKIGKDTSTVSRRLSSVEAVPFGELLRMAKILDLEIVIRGVGK